MTDCLVHRGPDGRDQWFDANTGVGLGHRRLAIVDLSDAGRQPMVSHSGRYVVTFNGEIYNFPTLRRELETLGSRFVGHSDTEVMLAAFDRWGVRAAVRRLSGMFAIAVWDSVSQELILIRDRLGKKPVYYATVNGALVFCSELKALRHFPGFEGEVDRDALALFMRHNYIPCPWTIYRGVRKLAPATLLRARFHDGALQYDSESYWSVGSLYELEPPSVMPDHVAVAELEALLGDAVATRMVADVPLGAFLSGGIDSSLVVALMQSHSLRKVDTFTIGFREQPYDEAPQARAVARHLGTNHTEVYVTPEEARASIPLMARIFDEPFADSSQIPTYLVSKVARQSVTVALSGDGGDELFCGYERYLKWRRIWAKANRVPRILQRLTASAITTLSPTVLNAAARPLFKMMRNERGLRTAGEKLHKLARVMGSNDPNLLYREFVTHWGDPESLVLGSHEPLTLITVGGGPLEIDEFTRHMMLLDIVTYLPDDILVKVDRASMAVSLETRAPLLDHRVVEFAARLPLSQKLRDGRTKWILRKLLERYIPGTLWNRPKMGFGIPIDVWLRGPLREWAESLLSESRLRREGFLNPAPIRSVWEAHLSERSDAQFLLWDVLMFQSWIDDVHRAS